MSERRSKRTEVEYILGHSPHEIERLKFQASILKPLTERLLRKAGIAEGMRVLDLGCGAGDVSLLAAELVGGGGEVVGIDRSAEALSVARARAEAGGYSNVTFHEASAETYAADEPFDLAIGRYVLIHQADPATFIRAAASRVKTGGTVAFHEVGIYGEWQSLPHVPLWRQIGDWIHGGFGTVLVHPDAGGRMMAHFHAAGLGVPSMFCEIPVGGGPDAPFYTWVAHTVRSLLPQIEKAGVATEEEIEVDTLEQRLSAAACATHAQLLGPRQFCGWVKV